MWIGVGLLGGAGSLLRYGLDARVQRAAARDFPLGTLVINVTGSFCLGLLTGLAITGNGILLLGTGLLGSFTTFSTWLLETQRLAEEGAGRLALLNLAVALAAGSSAAGLGWLIGALL